MLRGEWNLDRALAVREREGVEKTQEKVARKLIARGDKADDIAELTGLTVDDVLKLMSE